MKKCKLCKKHEVDWYGQALDGEDKKLSFYRPGYHIRGFAILLVCDECWETRHEWTAKQWKEELGKKKSENVRTV